MLHFGGLVHIKGRIERPALMLLAYFSLGCADIRLKILMAQLFDVRDGSAVTSTASCFGAGLYTLYAGIGILGRSGERHTIAGLAFPLYACSVMLAAAVAALDVRATAVWFFVILLSTAASQAALAVTAHHCLQNSTQFLRLRSLGSLGYGFAAIVVEILRSDALLVIAAAGFCVCFCLTRKSDSAVACGVSGETDGEATPKRIGFPKPLIIVLIAGFLCPWAARMWDSFGIVFLDRQQCVYLIAVMIAAEFVALNLAPTAMKFQDPHLLTLAAPLGWLLANSLLYAICLGLIRACVPHLIVALMGVSLNCLSQSILQTCLPRRAANGNVDVTDIHLLQAVTAIAGTASLLLLTAVPSDVDESLVFQSAWRIGTIVSALVCIATAVTLAYDDMMALSRLSSCQTRKVTHRREPQNSPDNCIENIVMPRVIVIQSGRKDESGTESQRAGWTRMAAPGRGATVKLDDRDLGQTSLLSPSFRHFHRFTTPIRDQVRDYTEVRISARPESMAAFCQRTCASVR